jgi:hypothetical protein
MFSRDTYGLSFLGASPDNVHCSEGSALVVSIKSPGKDHGRPANQHWSYFMNQTDFKELLAGTKLLDEPKEKNYE